MRLFRLLGFILVAAFISSCITTRFPLDDSGSMEKKEFVKTLLGKSKDDVVKKMGLPEQLLYEGDRQFMIYSDITASRQIDLPVLLFFFPMPAYETYDSPSLHCFRIELDSNNIVKDYKITSIAVAQNYENCQGDWVNHVPYNRNTTLSGEPSPQLQTIPDTVSCFSGGTRQWVERSLCD